MVTFRISIVQKKHIWRWQLSSVTLLSNCHQTKLVLTGTPWDHLSAIELSYQQPKNSTSPSSLREPERCGSIRGVRVKDMGRAAAQREGPGCHQSHLHGPGARPGLWGWQSLGKSPGGCGDLRTEPQDGNAEHSRAGEGAQRRRE